LKKLLGLAILGLVLTGCGNKVTCTSKGEDSEFSNAKITMTFSGDKIKKQKAEMTMDVSDMLESSNMTIDQLYDAMKGQYDEFDEKGIKVDLKKGKKSITIIVDIDTTKVSKEAYEEFGMSPDEEALNMSKADVIKSFEDEGFTCK
jgi:uncharacterized lipoprotein YehR (DUF1307 family)